MHEATAPVGNGAAPDAPRPGGMILLVEDDGDLRYMARRALERLGYRVLVAGTGERALALFHEHQEDIDLVLSDAGLPGLDGSGLYRAVRARSARVKFLLSSGSAPAGLDVRDGAGEPIPFMQKPWSLEQLAAAVEQVLAS